MELGLNNLWPTKILYGRLNSFKNLELLVNDILTQEIFQEIKEQKLSDNFFNNQNKSIKKFKEEEVIPSFKNYLNLIGFDDSILRNFEVKGWIVSSDKTKNMLYHNHSNCQFSAVFYLLSDLKEKSGGEIVFHDPRTNANRGYDTRFSHLFAPEKVTPKSGDFLIFPSYLYHHVNTVFSQKRMALAVDLFLYTKP
jgi:hypothetical protein